MPILPILLTAFLGFGCAAKKMAAQNADMYLEHQIEQRLPLYSAQKTALAKDVDRFLTEQKEFAKVALPAIKSIELDANKIDRQYDHLEQIYRNLALNFAKLMSRYMAQLDHKQQKDFAKNLKDENTTLARLTADARIEKIAHRFESIFGSLSDEQRNIIKSHKSRWETRHLNRLKRREALHAKFTEIYKQDLSNDGRTKYFVEAFHEYQRSYPESEHNKEILKLLIPTLSPKQRVELQEKSNDLQEILGHYLETDY